MKKPLVQYIWHPHWPDQLAGCMVALIHPNDQKIHIGWSQCNLQDNHFSKQRGRGIATGRALKGTDVQPRSYRFYSPDGSFKKVDIFGPELTAFSARALLHFSYQLAPNDWLTVEEQLVVIPVDIPIVSCWPMNRNITGN